jgi:hypothetical protein
MLRRILLSLSLAFVLASCMDVQNVSTFASSVGAVTSATTIMTASDRKLCASINATVAELAQLPAIGAAGATANCDELGRALDAIDGVNKVLDNYGKALGNISQGTFVNYDSDVTALQGVFKSLPAKWQPTAAESTALSGLAGWIASVATEAKRDKAIHAAMIGDNGAMQTNFHQVVQLLGRLVRQYAEAQDTNVQITKAVLGLVDHTYKTSEPVAVAEMHIRLAPNTSIPTDQAAAIRQYQTTLDSMAKAFDTATKNATAKTLLSEVKDFATQARSVYQSFAKAFPQI